LCGITFDFKAMKAEKQGKLVEFSPRELELLQYLVAHSSEVVTRSEILQGLWRYDEDREPTTRTIDNYIVKLRQKLEKSPNHPKHILTVHGRGYRLER